MPEIGVNVMPVAGVAPRLAVRVGADGVVAARQTPRLRATAAP
jgi:hypothetical protein